jgi:hypothetical protein
MKTISSGAALSRRPIAVLAALLAAGMLLGPAAAGAGAKPKGKSKAGSKAPESLKLLVKPPEVSLNDALEDEFSVEVSGRSVKHAALEVYLETESKAKCAPNAPTEGQTEGVEEQNPETFETSFTGSFDWDTNTLAFTKGVAKTGVKLICAYLSPPGLTEQVEPSAEEKRIGEEKETYIEPKTVPLKPILTAHAKLTLIAGKVPKAKGGK